jgi:hypothetical protein
MRQKRRQIACYAVLDVTKLPMFLDKVKRLLERAEKLQAKETSLACRFLSQDFCGDRWRLARDETCRCSGGSRDGEVDDLVGTKDVLAGNAGAKSADIKGFREFDEV